MKNALLYSILILGLASTLFSQPQEAAKSSSLVTISSAAEQLNAEVAKHAEAGSPGLAVVVIKNGETKYKKVIGLADLETKAPLTAQTPIYIASLSKQFTAMSIMMLEEKRDLSYDDKLTKYFPELASFAGDITIRHLLTHTSGLIDHLDIAKDSVTGWTNGDVVDLLKRENRVLFPPGEKVSYSNSGYVLLSMIVEKVSGEPFAAFLNKNIFRPIGMNRTTLAVRGASTSTRARGYSNTDGKWSVNDYDAFTTGGGGIYSTLDDMEKWDRSLSERPLIKPETLRLASTANKLNNGRPTAFGFGWLAEFAEKGDLANVWYVASFGDFKGFKAMHKRIPERRFSVILLSNGGKFPWGIIDKAQALFANDARN